MDRDTIIRNLMKQRHGLLGYILAIVRDQHLAEDVFQETLVRATNHESGFETVAHLMTWCRTVARNESIDMLRKRGRQPLMLDDDTLALIDRSWSDSPSPVSDDLAEALELCLGKLTDRARSVIEMRFAQSMTGDEIAQHTGGKVASVHQMLYRTYRQLHDCVTARLAPAEDRP